MRALGHHSKEKVQHQLGLRDGWQVFQFIAISQARGLVPIEVAGTEPAFRFAGYNWGEDPILTNISAATTADGEFEFNIQGGDNELFPKELRGVEVLLCAVVLIAVTVIVIWQQFGGHPFRNNYGDLRFRRGIGRGLEAIALRPGNRRVAGKLSAGNRNSLTR